MCQLEEMGSSSNDKDDEKMSLGQKVREWETKYNELLQEYNTLK